MADVVVVPLAEHLLVLARAQQHLLGGLSTALAEDGTSVDQWRVLACISRLSAPTMGEIAEATGLANATLSRVVDALEDRAAVFRHQDAADRRRIAVHLTELGQQRLTRADAIADAWSASAQSSLGAEAITAVARAADLLQG
ncbi:MAG: MarR family transcriptional regulator [Actinobacteria bacterium]|nr:MarR family transcriptional regulator [Actinomycetota bacterium]